MRKRKIFLSTFYNKACKLNVYRLYLFIICICSFISACESTSQQIGFKYIKDNVVASSIEQDNANHDVPNVIYFDSYNESGKLKEVMDNDDEEYLNVFVSCF